MWEKRGAVYYITQALFVLRMPFSTYTLLYGIVGLQEKKISCMFE